MPPGEVDKCVNVSLIFAMQLDVTHVDEATEDCWTLEPGSIAEAFRLVQSRSGDRSSS